MRPSRITMMSGVGALTLMFLELGSGDKFLGVRHSWCSALSVGLLCFRTPFDMGEELVLHGLNSAHHQRNLKGFFIN